MRLPRFRPRSRGIALTAGLVLTATGSAAPVAAQGSLGTLGFGYPVGGLSTRAAATGGAFGEFDALTPHNPAAVGGIARTVVTAQAEPEFRTLRLGDVSERTTSQRIPLVGVVLPFRHGLAFGFSGASFLDRSYSVRTRGTAVVDDRTVSTNDLLDVRGAIGKLTGTVGWQVNPRFKVGLSGQLFTGDNTVSRERTFADSLRLGGVNESSRVTYYGTALTIGGEARLLADLVGTVSYRRGNGLDARVRDTVRARGDVPDRLAASLRYDGIRGAIFAVGVEQVTWSRMASLGSTLVNARDAFNWNAGTEVAGPRLRGLPVMFRAGYARNALPFSTTSTAVRESRIAGGIGLPVARDAGSLDLSVQRVYRSLAGSSAQEASWLLGVGIQIRP